VSFSLFGGRIEGRQIELVPRHRVGQAWRFGAEHPSSWEPGVYSTVRFTLEPAGDGTRLVIDRTGIPAEWIEHISGGYPAFYEDPIMKSFRERIEAADPPKLCSSRGHPAPKLPDTTESGRKSER
jgi:activator of HSP90 ATPase